MNEAEDPLDDLFRQTATLARDPAFVARVMTDVRRHRPAAAAPSPLIIAPLKALGLAVVAAAGAVALEIVAGPAGRVFDQPAVVYPLLGLAALAVGLGLTRRGLV